MSSEEDENVPFEEDGDSDGEGWGVAMADVSPMHTFAGGRYNGTSSRVPSLQLSCANVINRKWDQVPPRDIEFLVNGEAPEAVQRLVVKRLAKHRVKQVVDSVLPATGIFGSDNPEERLLFLEQLAHDLALLKTQEQMRSEVHNWCSKLRWFLEADPSEKLSVEDVEETDMNWRLKQVYTKFPRPQCDSEAQIRQILDILDRTRIISYASDGTDVGKDHANTLLASVEIQVRAPSKEIKKMLKALPDGGATSYNNSKPIKAKRALCGKKEGKIVLTYEFAHDMPKYGDPSAKISLLIGTERFWGYKLFRYETSYGGDEFSGDHTARLQALKARILHGAPGMEEAVITDSQFMTLLLMIFLGHKQGGYAYEHLSYFAGYFANDRHQDNFYS